MKNSFILLLLSVVLFFTACSGDDYVPGCKKAGTYYCTNYTGPDHYYNKTTDDLRFECEGSSGTSGTYYAAGCPTGSAYAVCRTDDYDSEDGVEHVFYETTGNLLADGIMYSTDDCTILNNN